jgi:hypothetical protein
MHTIYDMQNSNKTFQTVKNNSLDFKKYLSGRDTGIIGVHNLSESRGKEKTKVYETIRNEGSDIRDIEFRDENSVDISEVLSINFVFVDVKLPPLVFDDVKTETYAMTAERPPRSMILLISIASQQIENRSFRVLNGPRIAGWMDGVMNIHKKR